MLLLYKMESQKIINLLDSNDIESQRFVAKRCTLFMIKAAEVIRKATVQTIL